MRIYSYRLDPPGCSDVFILLSKDQNPSGRYARERVDVFPTPKGEAFFISSGIQRRLFPQSNTSREAAPAPQLPQNEIERRIVEVSNYCGPAVYAHRPEVFPGAVPRSMRIAPKSFLAELYF